MARSFTDTQGDQWSVSISIGTAKSLLPNIDVLDPQRLADAIENPFDRFAILWAACKLQAEQKGIVSPEEFDLRLVDSTASAEEQERVWVEAETAVREALEDFFRRIGQTALADLLKTAIETRQKMEQMGSQKMTSEKSKKLITQAILKAEREIDKKFDQTMETLGTPSRS